MVDMKLKFSTQSLMLVTAFIGVTLASALWNGLQREYWIYYVIEVVQISVFFIPIIFAAYALGRRTLTWQLVLAFAIAQGATAWLGYIIQELLIP